ncbi:transketolase [Thalassomonas viridans]|uniref:Transketolase n=2 Tax=Thalassomonas viridans TaxID=137584 RepID=A0AAF0CEA8_9GAMM|nr:transketolase [Thalassomonas viridans]
MAVAVQENASQSLAEEVYELKGEILKTLYAAGGGHYGGCLSVIDILVVLYRYKLRINPAVPEHAARDRFILSKGHAAVALYAVLQKLGYFQDNLLDYSLFGSALEGHPDMLTVPGIDFSSGSLGQGVSVGLGMALSLPRDNNVWVVLGDGECQEGQIWESAMLACNTAVSNLKVIVDCNKHQEWGWAERNGEKPAPVSDMVEKWRAFGWHVVECDGHDHRALMAAMDEVDAHSGQPAVIIAHTVKGKGVVAIEKDPVRFHCGTVTEIEHYQIMRDYS